MTKERWKRINEIVAAAWECAPERRAALLVDLCGGDMQLRAEVESLLEADQGAQEFLTEPLPDPTTVSMLGRTVGAIGSCAKSAAAAWGRCIWRSAQTASFASLWRSSS